MSYPTERELIEMEKYNWLNKSDDERKDFYFDRKLWLENGGISTWPLEELMKEKNRQERYPALDDKIDKDQWWNKSIKIYLDYLEKQISYRKAHPTPTAGPDPILPVDPPYSPLDPDAPPPATSSSYLPVVLFVSFGVIGMIFLFKYFENRK